VEGGEIIGAETFSSGYRFDEGDYIFERSEN